MATISRCQSPTHSAFSPLLSAPTSSIIHHTRLQQMTSVLNHTQNSLLGSCSNIQLQDVISSSKPLYPEICLDHVWTENVGIPKYVSYFYINIVIVINRINRKFFSYFLLF